MTSDEKTAMFPKGSFIRLNPSDIESYIEAVASKLRDRVGEVTGYTYPYSDPIVTFYAIGRRKQHIQSFSHCSGKLEIVVDEKEIALLREEVAETAAKAEKAQVKKLALRKKAAAAKLV